VATRLWPPFHLQVKSPGSSGFGFGFAAGGRRPGEHEPKLIIWPIRCKGLGSAAGEARLVVALLGGTDRIPFAAGGHAAGVARLHGVLTVCGILPRVDQS